MSDLTPIAALVDEQLSRLERGLDTIEHHLDDRPSAFWMLVTWLGVLAFCVLCWIALTAALYLVIDALV